MSDTPKVRLRRTNSACPESYEVHRIEDGAHLGWFRLRHGEFTARTPDDQLVYSAAPEGDGCFRADERVHYLNAGVRALLEGVKPMETEPIYEIDPESVELIEDWGA